MSGSDLLENVHAQVRGEVRDCLSTEVGQRDLCKRLRAKRFLLLIAFQTHILQNTAEDTDDVTVSAAWISEGRHECIFASLKFVICNAQQTLQIYYNYVNMYIKTSARKSSLVLLILPESCGC